MSTYASLYAVPKASFDNYIKYRLGNFPNVKNLKVEQLNFNEAKKLNAVHNGIPRLDKTNYTPFNQQQLNINKGTPTPGPYYSANNNAHPNPPNDPTVAGAHGNDQQAPPNTNTLNASSIAAVNGVGDYSNASDVADNNAYISSLFENAAATASHEDLNQSKRTIRRGHTIDTPREEKSNKPETVDAAIGHLEHSIQNMRNQHFIQKNKSPKYKSTPRRRAAANNSNPVAFQTRTQQKVRADQTDTDAKKPAKPELLGAIPKIKNLTPNFNVSKNAGKHIKKKADELLSSSKK